MDKLLSQKIDESGLKFGYIAKKLNMTTYTLHGRLSGKTEFRVDEAKVLSTLLNLKGDDVMRIFFNENVNS